MPKPWMAAISALALLTSACSFGVSHASRHSPGPHPNIVFLLTDDLDAHEVAYMPNLRRLLTDEGVTFSRFYVSVSLCCPSRSSILRGQYSHNTGILTNGSGNGGFETAYRLRLEQSTIGTWLQKAGYKTAYIGKYLNAYPDTAHQNYEPPGWNEFDSAVRGNPYSEYNYTLNQNGRLVRYGNRPDDYGTNVYVGMADEFIRHEKHHPFFIYLNSYAPHGPATPAPQDVNRFPTAKAPRTPAFNVHEAGKPAWLRRLRALRAPGIANIDAAYRLRIRSLQAVDRGVATLIATLRDTHELSNTYFVFSSDNGFHLGQFRLPAGKETAYETDIKVPLIVRGPGVPRHRTCAFLFGNIDLAPTFARLAGTGVPMWVDGRSFAAQLRDPAVDAHPRQAYLVEHWKESRTEHIGRGPTEPPDHDADVESVPVRIVTAAPGVPPPRKDLIPEFHGARTVRYLYVEYVTGERELYDTRTDPYELHNIVDLPADHALVERLHVLVARLEVCSAAVCRRLEDEPLPS
jgi:arylsulfatase A-like enzyme